MTTPGTPRKSGQRLPKAITWVMAGLLVLQLAWTIFLAAVGGNPVTGIQGMIIPAVILVTCAIWLTKVKDREQREAEQAASAEVEG